MTSAEKLNGLNKLHKSIKGKIQAAKMAGADTAELEAMVKRLNEEKRTIINGHTGQKLGTYRKPTAETIKSKTAVLGLPDFMYR